MTTSHSAPVTPSASRAGTKPRMLIPDITRGLALLGIALANVQTAWLVNRAGSADQGGSTHSTYFGGYTEGSTADTIFSLLSAVFFHVRGLPTFTVLLGFGIGLISISLWNKNFPLPRARQVLVRRYLFLALFGALHTVLLFYGDIMLTYGILGLAVIAMIGLSNKTIGWITGILFAITVAFGVFSSVAMYFWGGNLDFFGFENYSVGSSASDYFGEGIVTLIASPLQVLFTGFGMLPLMLMGLLWARRGVLANVDRHRTELFIWLVVATVISFGLGIPWGLAEIGAIDASLKPVLSLANMFLGFLTGPGILAAIALLCNGAQKRMNAQRADGIDAQPPVLMRPFIALGKRSMSGYVMQSILFFILVLPFTLNLAEGMTVTGLVGIGFGVWLATLVLAYLWELAGWTGPFEKVHRRLSYGPGSQPRLNPKDKN